MVLKCTFFNEKIEFILKLLKKYVLYIFSSLIMVSFFSCSIENNFIILTSLCILVFCGTNGDKHVFYVLQIILIRKKNFVHCNPWQDAFKGLVVHSNTAHERNYGLFIRHGCSHLCHAPEVTVEPFNPVRGIDH